MKVRNLILAGFCAAAVAGCSGGGSSGVTAGGDGGGGGGSVNTVAAAVAKGTSSVVADKISVLDANNAQSSGKTTAKLVSEFSATADWNKDKSYTYVHDRSTDVFENVNEILCQISQTGYVAMAGKGPYKALINKNLCKGNDSTSNAGSSQQGDTSGSAAPDYNTWTVDSLINAAGKLEAHVWVHEKAESHGDGFTEPAKVITAKLVVSKTKDEVPPYGLFRIDFIGFDEQSGVVKFKGLLETVQDANGVVTLRFADKDLGQQAQFEEKAAVIKDTTTTGHGSVYQLGNDNGQPQTYSANFAFNGNYFRRTSANEDKCFDRLKFEESAWRYGLYDFDSGNRITVKSGLPFNTKQDGSGAYGWIGFWGTWLPDGATVVNNTVYSKDPGTGVTTPYTLNTYSGKLKKHTQHTTTMADIVNIPLEGYMEGQPPNQLNYRVIWTGSKLQKVASSPAFTSGAPTWKDISSQNLFIDTAQLQFGELNFWSQALGGQVRIKLANCTFNAGTTSCTAPDGATTVIYYTEDIVYPGDAVLAKTLTCYDNCPKAADANGLSYDTNGNPTTYAQSFTPNSAGHAYTMSNMVLMDGPNPAVLTVAGTNNNWGFGSGALIESTPANQALLACDWDQNQVCGWKAWSLPVFYTWETGPNNWNRLSTVKDANNNLVTFEPPVRVEYTHAQTDANAPDAKYNGVKFQLDYNGFGELQGIPGKCFDMSTNTETLDCSGSNKRWVPEFSIAAGSTVKAGSTTYYVKPLEIEQRMIKKGAAVCDTAGVTAPAAAVTLPSATDAVDPGLYGHEPAGDVKVIGGVIQTSATTGKSILKKLFGF